MLSRRVVIWISEIKTNNNTDMTRSSIKIDNSHTAILKYTKDYSKELAIYYDYYSMLNELIK